MIGTRAQNVDVNQFRYGGVLRDCVLKLSNVDDYSNNSIGCSGGAVYTGECLTQQRMLEHQFAMN